MTAKVGLEPKEPGLVLWDLSFDVCVVVESEVRRSAFARTVGGLHDDDVLLGRA
jgi:hypothetical protein